MLVNHFKLPFIPTSSLLGSWPNKSFLPHQAVNNLLRWLFPSNYSVYIFLVPGKFYCFEFRLHILTSKVPVPWFLSPLISLAPYLVSLWNMLLLMETTQLLPYSTLKGPFLVSPLCFFLFCNLLLEDLLKKSYWVFKASSMICFSINFILSLHTILSLLVLTSPCFLCTCVMFCLILHNLAMYFIPPRKL